MVNIAVYLKDLHVSSFFLFFSLNDNGFGIFVLRSSVFIILDVTGILLVLKHSRPQARGPQASLSAFLLILCITCGDDLIRVKTFNFTWALCSWKWATVKKSFHSFVIGLLWRNTFSYTTQMPPFWLLTMIDTHPPKSRSLSHKGWIDLLVPTD